MGLEIREAQLSPQVLEFNVTNEGGVDGTYRVLKNIAGLWLVQQCRRAFEKTGINFSYAQLVRLAQHEPALRSLIDPDDSSFANPPSMPIAIRNFCHETRQPAPKSEGALIRCALESLALKYQVTLTILEQIGGTKIETIHVVGGGSKNDLLNQFTADACNRHVLAGPAEATALGNVLMQARACGEIGSLAEIRAIVRASSEMESFEPNLKVAAAWQDARARFETILSQRQSSTKSRTSK
jgi:rhamnulokinase